MIFLSRMQQSLMELALQHIKELKQFRGRGFQPSVRLRVIPRQPVTQKV